MTTIDPRHLGISRTRYNDTFIYYINDQMIGGGLKYYGEYQQIEIDFLNRFAITNDSVVYDIGGNVGYHASAFGAYAKEVHSFEANPTHYQLLKWNTDNNEKITAHNFAVSSTPGTILIEDFDTGKYDNYGAVRVGAESGVEVPAKSLDDLVNANELPPPDVMKVDVEGHELDVMRGCTNLIEKYKPKIYFEAQETEDLAEIYDFLTERGYEMVWLVIRNFNANNFYKQPFNVFLNSAIFSIYAVQPGQIPEGYNWHKVKRDDTLDTIRERMQKSALEGSNKE